MLEQFSLEGRVALITGSRRGLGQAMARGLAEAGADIAGVSRSQDAEQTRRLVESAGRSFVHWSADLTDADQRRGLVERTVEHFGRIDILINNAGESHREPPETFPLESWERVMGVHVTAAMDLSQQCHPYFVRNGRGKIINIGSIMSYEAGWQIPAYAAAKHAIAGLTKSLAVSWSSQGINVNCIAPGYFDCDIPESLRKHPQRATQILDRIPCGRWGMPDEIAGLAVFLASNASNYMHGSVVPIDGGWLSR
jgi:2-deoxy-D-gluconate 3-dehydrogenase